MSDERIIHPDDIVLLHRTHFNMTNHTPDSDQVERIERIRDTFRQLASMIYVNCPKSRERSLALTGLEDTLMWAIASIAREDWSQEDLYVATS